MTNYQNELWKEHQAQREAEEKAQREAKEAKQLQEAQSSAWNQLSPDDQKALLNPDKYEPTIDEQDSIMRQSMRTRAQNGDQEAVAWVSADERALKAESNKDALEGEINRRREHSYVGETYEALSQVREKIDEHHKNRPSIFDRKEWKEQLAGLEKEEQQADQHWKERIQKSSRNELGKLQERLEGRHKELQAAESERQGIALLPSEAKTIEAAIKNYQEVSLPNDYLKDAIKARRENQGSQEDQQKKRMVA